MDGTTISEGCASDGPSRERCRSRWCHIMNFLTQHGAAMVAAGRRRGRESTVSVHTDRSGKRPGRLGSASGPDRIIPPHIPMAPFCHNSLCSYRPVLFLPLDFSFNSRKRDNHPVKTVHPREGDLVTALNRSSRTDPASVLTPSVMFLLPLG